MKEYAAGIVLYNPDKDRLKLNIEAIYQQVKCVICYDNGMDEYSRELLSHYKNVSLIGDGTNVGIASALNAIIKEVNSFGIEWIITLDQDSIVCDNMVEALSSLIKERNVAVICPLIRDYRRKNEKIVDTEQDWEDVNFCITSGSFMNVGVIKEIGGFDDYLFIGLVDNDICYRIIDGGYRIIRNNKVILNHQLGNIIPSKFEKLYLKLGDMLNNQTIKKMSYKRMVSPLRLYYATRNMIYLKHKYNLKNNKKINCNYIYNGFSSILRGKSKHKLIKAFFSGIIDGKGYIKSKEKLKG